MSLQSDSPSAPARELGARVTSSITVSTAAAAALGLLCGALGSTDAAVAAERAGAPEKLEEVIVSATRNEALAIDVPATVESISREEMDRQQLFDIRDVVRDLPNVSVRRGPARFSLAGSAAGRDQNSGFNIRGLEGNRVLMLVDGLRMPRSYAFSANSFGRDYVDLSLLKRIEIVKGASSSLYGSDGLAGLVNFVTHDPKDFVADGDRLGGRLHLQGSGEDDALALSGTVAGRFDERWSWLVTAQGYEASELSNRGGNDAANVDRTTPNPQEDRGKSALAKLVFEPRQGRQYGLTVEYVDKDSDYRLLSAQARQPLTGTAAQIAAAVIGSDAWTETERTRATLRAHYDLASALANELNLTASWQSTDSREYAFEDRNTLADRVRDVIYSEDAIQAVAQAVRRWELSDDRRTTLTYGVDFQSIDVFNLQTGLVPPAGETFPLKRFPDTRERTWAGFAQLEIEAGRWVLTPAVRYDRFDIDASQSGFSPPSTTPAASISDSAVTPRLGVLFRATEHVNLYGNFGIGFRAPNAGQVNAFFENATGFYKTIPNPGLEPETSRSGEVGVRFKSERIDLEAAYFDSRYEDFIEDSALVSGRGVAGDPLVFQSINVQEARISGYELRGEARLGDWAGGSWTIPLSYGQTRGEDRRTRVPLATIDPAKARIALDYRAQRFDLRIGATRHRGKKFGDTTGLISGAAPFLNLSATVLDASAQWRFTDSMRLNLAVENLTDEKYWLWSSVRGLASNLATIDAYTQPGRYVAASFIVEF